MFLIFKTIKGDWGIPQSPFFIYEFMTKFYKDSDGK